MNAPKNVAVATAHACTIEVPYGHLQIVKGGVIDHVAMRIDQLSALLLLISCSGLDNFLIAETNDQQSLLWLANSMAVEIRDLMPLMAEMKSEVPA